MRPDNFKELPMNAGRVCSAIAKIGYAPYSAIMDIVDNSVAAGATHITIYLEIADGLLTQRNNILRYRIIDNGIGMTDSDIENALTLGSDANYTENSLSKYGMGLKSAGFSLGNTLNVYSKSHSTNTLSNLATLDHEIIEDHGYGLIRKPLDQCVEEIDTDLLDGHQSGTVIDIANATTPHDSANTTINHLKSRLGVTYAEFISRERDPITINIKYRDKCDNIDPIDFLFKTEATTEFDKESYDYHSPYLYRREHEIRISDDTNIAPILLSVSLFPAAKMSTWPLFPADIKNSIRSYQIARKNMGFFIFRNGRLIRWGDRLTDENGEDIIKKDDINIRATLHLQTCHDDDLHVDVSKQHIVLPEMVLSALRNELYDGRTYAAEIRSLCKQKLRQNSEGEGHTFNTSSAHVEPPSGRGFVTGRPLDPQNINERIKQLLADTNAAFEHINRSDDDYDEETQPVTYTDSNETIFRKIRYSNRVSSVNLWEVGEDSDYGHFVRINKNHPFYHSLMQQVDEASAERQLLEALLWALCHAEAETRIHSLLEAREVDEVVRLFKAVLGDTLIKWTAQHLDLY